MKYKTVTFIYGFIFLTCGVIMFSDVEPKIKIWILRILLSVVIETLFLLSILLLWKINYAAGVFRINVSSGSKLPNYILFACIFLVLFMSNFSILVFNLFYTANIPKLATFSFFCLGIYFQCLIYQVFLTFVCRLFLMLVKFKTNSSEYKVITAKQQSIIFYFTILFSFVMGVCGFVNANMPPVLEKVDIKLKNFPNSMDGFTILMITDVHLGITIHKEHLDQIIDVIADVDYDMLAAIGDFTDIPVSHAKEMAIPLMNLRPQYGKFFVTGNHEYYTGDVDDWLNFLSSLDMRVLRNENVIIPSGKDYFNLVGVDDIEARMLRMNNHGMNLEQAMRGIDGNHSTILLAHQPRAAKEALDNYNNIDLVLSGHTHGGQMLPMSILVYLSNPFFSGLYTYKHGQVYVSQGAVYWGVPMRMFSRAEVNLVRLFRDDPNKISTND